MKVKPFHLIGVLLIIVLCLALSGCGTTQAQKSASGGAALGALAGGLARNKSKRVDGSLEEVKRNDAQRNCLIGRGYNPIS